VVPVPNRNGTRGAAAPAGLPRRVGQRGRPWSRVLAIDWAPGDAAAPERRLGLDLQTVLRANKAWCRARPPVILRKGHPSKRAPFVQGLASADRAPPSPPATFLARPWSGVPDARTRQDRNPWTVSDLSYGHPGGLASRPRFPTKFGRDSSVLKGGWDRFGHAGVIRSEGAVIRLLNEGLTVPVLRMVGRKMGRRGHWNRQLFAQSAVGLSLGWS
jgi:hypothetical protein